MIHIRIAPDYQTNEAITEFVKTIPFTFKDKGRLLYNQRNIIKSFPFNSALIPFQQIVVKQFKEPGFIQRIIYSFFRSNKAVRAFSNAMELRKMGINTPHEIACIEEYQHKLVKATYTITCFTDGQPIRDFLNRPEGFDPTVARGFARFAVELHLKGILHQDLNSTNVLYHSSPQNNCFSVIDINRMKFKSQEEALTPEECFDNLTRFTGQMDLYEYVLQHYIEYRGWNSNLIENALRIKENHDKQWLRRKSFLKNLKKVYHV